MVARATSAKRDLEARRAFDADVAADDLEVARRAFQQVAGDRQGLVAHLDGGDVSRRSGQHRLPAVEAAKAERSRGAVAGRHRQISHVAAELLGDDLRQHGSGALTHGGGAAIDMDFAGRRDAHRHRLERSAAGALDVVGDADAEMAPVAARRRLPRPKPVPVRVGERHRLAGGVIAAVEHDLHAATRLELRAIRHLLRRNEIALAHDGAVYAERHARRGP